MGKGKGVKPTGVCHKWGANKVTRGKKYNQGGWEGENVMEGKGTR